MTSAVDYLILTVVHRTNEDWHLLLPLEIEDLEGARAVCVLASPQGVRIVLNAVIANGEITLFAESEVFDNKSGPFSGDVLLTLSGGRDIVTHIINLDLKRGVSGHG